jgi:hypothetical protein
VEGDGNVLAVPCLQRAGLPVLDVAEAEGELELLVETDA